MRTVKLLDAEVVEVRCDRCRQRLGRYRVKPSDRFGARLEMPRGLPGRFFPPYQGMDADDWGELAEKLERYLTSHDYQVIGPMTHARDFEVSSEVVSGELRWQFRWRCGCGAQPSLRPDVLARSNVIDESGGQPPVIYAK